MISCSICARSKASHSVYFVIGLPPSDSNTVIVDRFSKTVHFIPLAKSRTATGMSLFMAMLGYQPPLFHQQEREVAMQENIHRCRHVWRGVQAVLVQTAA